MATNLDLDDRLIEQARRVGGHKTKKEAVTTALEEYIKLKKRLALTEMAGTVDYWPDYDYKALRRKRG